MEDEGLLLTGDGRYVEVSATVEYAVDGTDPRALERFVFAVDDADAALRPMAESAVREVVARRELLELLTTGRKEAEEAAAALLRDRLAGYRFGLVVRRLGFQDIHPPLAVLDAYRDVSRAAGDRQRRVNEAVAYRDRVVTEAGGQARAIRAAADADRARQVAMAGASADASTAMLDARRYAPAITDIRLFWSAVSSAMAGREKLLIDEEPGRRRHLVFPESADRALLPAIERLRQDTPRGDKKDE